MSRLGESKLALWRQRHIGFIFQFYNLIPVLTGPYENVELPLTLRRSSRGGTEGRESRPPSPSSVCRIG